MFVFLCSSVCFRNVRVLACAGALKNTVALKPRKYLDLGLGGIFSNKFHPLFSLVVLKIEE